jgi:DNA repair protein RecO (recombination protein O)
MISKSKAIALHTVRFGESSLVAYLYTLEFGRITLMVNGAYGKGRSGKKAVFFQPLTLLDIVFYPGKNHGMGKLKEVYLSSPLKTLHVNPIKSAISLFVGEVVYRTIREEESNASLYQFIDLSILSLDAMDSGVSNFHLLFIAQLSKHLGFYPSGQFSDLTPFFDYKNGFFVSREPSHPMFFSADISKLFFNCLTTPFGNADSIHLSGNQRSLLLNHILNFFSYHMDSVSSIRSLPVLSQVFEE